MATRDEIVKQNLEFVYGKRTHDVLDDPDKVSYRPTKAKYVDPDAITSFAGEFEFLAPTFACKVYLPEESTPYPSFEHALLASKFKNDDKRQEVRTLSQIKDVKRLISKEKGKNSVLFADWTERCISIAEMLLLDKFIRNKKLKEQLMKTGRRTLIFKNDFGDLFWGVDETQKGQNQLGKLLEKVRSVIDAGEEVDTWIRHQVKLIEPEKVSLEVIVMKEGVKVTEDCKTIELKSKFFIGKSDDMCDIVAAHPTVSRVHAMLVVERARGKLQVIDLGSANGTKLNNTPLLPFEIATVDVSSVLTFGASARQYSFVVDTTADVKRKQTLLDKIATEQKSTASTYGGASAEETAINTVFVGNIAFDATEADIKAFFAPCGAVLQMNVPKDRATGAHKGIAFVTFADFKGVMQALARDSDELCGRNVKVKKSDAKKPTAAGAGGREGRDGDRGGRGGKEGGGRMREERDHRTQEEKDRERNNGTRGGGDGGREGGRGDRNDRGDGARGKYGLQGRGGDRSPPRREARTESTRSDRDTERRGDSRDGKDGRRRDDRDSDRRGDRRADSRDRDRGARRDSSRDRRDGGRDSRREADNSQRDRKRQRSDSRDRRSPPRGRRQRSPSPNPRRSKSRSPPGRVARVENNDKTEGNHRVRSPSPSPVRRKPVDPSPSPPRRGRNTSPSPSPPRRGRAAPSASPSPPRRNRQPSASPPRRAAAAAGSARTSSPSPPRRQRVASPAASPSPPRRARAPSASPSPPRRQRQPSPSPSPPRKPRAALSPARSASRSPPRRGQRSPSPAPPRKSRFN